MHRSRLPALVLVATLSVVPVAGCSDSGDDLDVDTTAIKDGFAQAAQAAYQAEGASRADDFQRGVNADCFLLDDAAANELTERLGIDVEVRAGFLSGPEDDESISCAFNSPDNDELVYVGVAISDVDRDDLLDLQEGREKALEERDNDVDGLDGDDVLVLGDDESTQASFIRGGLRISVGGRVSEAVTDESVLEVLPFVVGEVQRALTGSGGDAAGSP